jgi:hypothetical protein
MQTINQIAIKLANRLHNKSAFAIDYYSEIENYYYDKKLFNIVDKFGQGKFEDLVISKIIKLEKIQEQNFYKEGK